MSETQRGGVTYGNDIMMLSNYLIDLGYSVEAAGELSDSEDEGCGIGAVCLQFQDLIA